MSDDNQNKGSAVIGSLAVGLQVRMKTSRCTTDDTGNKKNEVLDQISSSVQSESFG